MRVVNILRVIEEQLYSESTSKNFSGSFRDLEFLLQHASILNKRFKGLFAYFAFHPVVDEHVAKYVLSGALEGDSGPEIMVLFIVGQSCEIPRTLTSELLGSGIAINDGDNVPDIMINSMFPKRPSPVPPGIIFFDQIVDVEDVIYVSLYGAASLGEVANIARTALSRARVCAINRGVSDHWVSQLGSGLESAGIAYQRTGRASSSEWFQVFLRRVWAKNFNVASVISIISKAVERLLK